MVKRILPVLVLASLAGCQAPEGLPTVLDSEPSYRTQHLEDHHKHHKHHHPHKRKRKKHRDDEETLTLVQAPPEALVERIELRPADAAGAWDAATFELERLDTPGVAQAFELDRDVDLRSSGSSFVATGSILTDLPPGNYRATVSLWRDGAYGTLAGEDQKVLKLSDGSNTLKLSPTGSGTLGLVGFDPVSAVPGATVSVIGQGFSLLPGQDLVTLGGKPVQVLGATSTRLSVVVPGLSPGKYVWWVQVGSGMVGKADFAIE